MKDLKAEKKPRRIYGPRNDYEDVYGGVMMRIRVKEASVVIDFEHERVECYNIPLPIMNAIEELLYGVGRIDHSVEIEVRVKERSDA